MKSLSKVNLSVELLSGRDNRIFWTLLLIVFFTIVGLWFKSEVDWDALRCPDFNTLQKLKSWFALKNLFLLNLWFIITNLLDIFLQVIWNLSVRVESNNNAHASSVGFQVYSEDILWNFLAIDLQSAAKYFNGTFYEIEEYKTFVERLVAEFVQYFSTIGNVHVWKGE